jgi:hypothetical protein
MVNLLGEAGYVGEAIIEGLEEALDIEGVYPHLYGKKITKPFRKMGHVTILDQTIEGLKSKSEQVKQLIKDVYGKTIQGSVSFEDTKEFDDEMYKQVIGKKEDGGMMAKGGRVGHSKEDKARFAKPAGWRWKEIAVTKRIIERKQLSMQPSKKMRDKYPDYVYYEDRLNKADKKPSRKYLSE